MLRDETCSMRLQVSNTRGGIGASAPVTALRLIGPPPQIESLECRTSGPLNVPFVCRTNWIYRWNTRGVQQLTCASSATNAPPFSASRTRKLRDVCFCPSSIAEVRGGPCIRCCCRRDCLFNATISRRAESHWRNSFRKFPSVNSDAKRWSGGN
jgi:hypothetical protein